MGLKLTKEQQYAVDLRNRKMLVAAAAGSGKTAVLVRRIIERILDNDDPIDVDELLVMTFTKAAAAEMRERILKSIEEAIDNTDESDISYQRIRRQAALIDSAKITTIDSFCLSIIREHTDITNLDPSFRVADEGETSLLKADTLEAVLEKYYEAADVEFLDFIDAFSRGKTDRGISDLILSMYNFAQATPWPKEWYQKQISEVRSEKLDDRDIEKLPWVEYIVNQINYIVEDIYNKIEHAIELCDEEAGPIGYKNTLLYELEQIENLRMAKNFKETNQALKEFNWPMIGRVSKTTDPELKDIVKNIRDTYKDTIKKLCTKFNFNKPETINDEIIDSTSTIKMIISLTNDFDEAYSKKKRDKNLVDFNDIEHMALEILWDIDESGVKTKSSIALEYSKQFDEIYVDEYQDSNYVQEELITAIEKGCVFMVGDVKQSIYAFRQARPELFNNKYKSYKKYTGTELDSNIRIDLSSNFRSRSSVLSSVNDVFRRLMTDGVGGINYDKAAALNPGLVVPECIDGKTAGYTELLLCDTQDLEADYSKREVEARMVAKRIKELTDKTTGIKIYDKDLGDYRKLKLSDIAILFRAQNGWAEIFVNILMSEGISAYAQTSTGYFDTIEVKTILSMLAVIDNPFQDIPLAAVLKSPIFKLTDSELAYIVAEYRHDNDKNNNQYRLYYVLENLIEKDNRNVLYEKVHKTLDTIEKYAIKARYTGLVELLTDIYNETGYYDYISAMPAGDIRKANLDMLLEKANSYEKTGYRGLFQFNRYIENLKKYDADFGEASTVTENDNTVRIMSIHKSKGLEFPVCFISGMSKKFNFMDSHASIIADPELGIACDHIDNKLRIKTTSIKKNIIAYRMKSEVAGEELRVLYVAMTRARDLLIMTAADNKIFDKKSKKQNISESGYDIIPASDVRNSTSYLDWIFMSMNGNDKNIITKEYLISELIEEETKSQSKKIEIKRVLSNIDTKPNSIMIDRINYNYPYISDINLHTKMSVSEIKTLGQNVDNTEDDQMIFDKGINVYEKSKVDIAEGKGVVSGAARGTIYHRILEKLDYDTVVDIESCNNFLDRLEKETLLSPNERKLVMLEDIINWINSPIGIMFKNAHQQGKLRRETQFIMSIPANEIGVSESDEPILIQGIIDAYIEEDKEIILIDYKTDHVSSESEFKTRYAKQLEYYAKALSMMKKKDVVSKIIWSFTLNRAIQL